MSSKSTSLLLTTITSYTLAHGIISTFITNGSPNTGFPTNYIYRIKNGNPIPALSTCSTSATDRGYIEPDMICHKDAVPGPLTASVTASGKVDFPAVVTVLRSIKRRPSGSRLTKKGSAMVSGRGQKTYP
ncbi:hypothetical protein G6011_08050 [Alternaria panax]|uniref:Uncharacterized protein n=1 Tax=Alternaria panax TaxID=48097 RepID=A0AAD4F9X2_9PLEO|nr:hypothetical protein G6011_08050 [Alternaria panax]